MVIQFDRSKKRSRSVSSLVIQLESPLPYISDKVMPYKYDANMIKNGQEVPLPTSNSVVSIVDVVKVTRSDHVFSPVFPKAVENVIVGKKAEVVVPLVDPVNPPICQSSESSSLKNKDDDDEVLHLIKKSGFNILVETGPSSNVLSKSTLARLSYQGAPMRYSDVIVKAFYGSRKIVIGEVDLPIKTEASMSSLKDVQEIV